MIGILDWILECLTTSTDLARYGMRFLRLLFLNRANSAAQIVALESQLDANLRCADLKRRFRFSNSFRLLWLIFVSYWSGWKGFCHVVEPKNHLDLSWAMDFCVVRAVGFRAYYVFVILEHGSRRVRHWNVTESPSLEWIIQQLREATPFGEVPRFIHRDNDGLYGKGVSMFLKASGVEEVRSAFRSPWQNPYIERFFGSMRREILNHVIILNEKHLRRLINE
jgi:transposase InsO family protein